MKKRMHLRRRFNLFSFSNKIVFTLVLIVFIVSSVFSILKDKIINIIDVYAENEIRNKSMQIINDAVYSNKDLFKDSLYETSVSKDDEILSVDINPEILNSITTFISQDIISSFNKEGFKDSSNVYYIPFGIINNNPLLIDLGPKMAIKATYNGSVLVNARTSLTPYGINNSLLKIYLEVSVNMSLIMPYVMKNVSISNDIPVLIKIIHGRVPSVYGLYYPFNETKSVIE